MTYFSRIAFAALWLFVLTVPVEKAFMLPGFGSVGRLTGVLALGIGGLTVLLERRVRIPSGFHVAYGCLQLWAAASVYWTIAHDVPGGIDFTYFRLTTYVQLFAMTLLVWQFAANREQVESLLRAYVLGCLIPFFATVRNYTSGQMHYYQRYSLDNTEPNDLALTLALSLPMAYYLFLRSKSSWRFLYLIQMLIALGTIFLTVSRGGIMATAVALTMVFWTRKELTARWRLGLVVLAGLGAVLAIAFVPITTWTRLATLGSEVTSGTLNQRTLIWHEGWKAFQKSPFVGIGLGAYPEAASSFFGYPGGGDNSGDFTPVAHNTFYSYLVETGIIGFSIFATTFGIVISYAVRMRGLERVFWLTLLATWTVGVNALSWDYVKPTWLSFVLLACHFAAVRTHQAEWSTEKWFRRAPGKMRGDARVPSVAWKEFVS